MIGSLTFQREETRDRRLISRRMREHVTGSTATGRKPASRFPLLIFPEGTCVNNEATVLFHRGAFDLSAWVCPVAIRYHKQTFDPYWNTREQTFTQHVAYLITRWFLVVDVWWLPPQQLQSKSGEEASAFAQRCKALISQQAGLANLQWNGYLKNASRPQDRERMRRSSQATYAQRLRQEGTLAMAMAAVEKTTAANFLGGRRADFMVGSLPQPPPLLSPPLSPYPHRDDNDDEPHDWLQAWREASKQEGREMRRLEYGSWRQWHLQRSRTSP